MFLIFPLIRKHEARAKRAMEQRALRAQQIDQEQKQKLENKEEKSANIKMKILAENQEKAEKYVKICHDLFFLLCNIECLFLSLQGARCTIV